MERFISMFSYKYFSIGKVSKNFIKNSKILDVGCGDTAKVSIAMAGLGSKNITLSDIGTNWMPNVKKNLKLYNINKNFWKLKSASVIKLPFKDEEFDFVICHGVLIHLSNIQDVKQAIKELCRVTKKKGAIYIAVGSEGGLVEKSLLPSIRSFYGENKTFKKFIDNLSPNKIIDLILTKKKYRNISFKNKFNLNEKILKRLFDEDFCVTVQNLIQVPKRLSIKERFYIKEFKKHNIKKNYRLARFVPQNNIRNIFSHLHYLCNAGNAGLIKVDKFSLDLISSIYGSGKQEYIFWK